VGHYFLSNLRILYILFFSFPLFTDQFYWYSLLEFCFIFVVFIVRKKAEGFPFAAGLDFFILKWRVLAAYVSPTLCSHVPAFQPSMLN